MEGFWKISIPSKKYNSSAGVEPEDRGEDLENVDDKEFDIKYNYSKLSDKEYINENLNIDHDEYSISNIQNEKGFEFIREKFENIRVDLNKKYDTEIDRIKKDAEEKIYNLLSERAAKLNSMNDLEKFVQNQYKIIKNPLEEIKTVKTELNIVSSKSSIKNINTELKNFNQVNFLLNCSTMNIYYCQDFKNIKILALPNKFNYKENFNLLIKNEREIYIANSNGTVQICDIYTNKFTWINSFTVLRKDFSMCYIDQYPGIIGGISKGISRPTVEVLVNDKWILLYDLNVPRHSCISIQHMGNTYVFGGKKNKKENTSVIEKYERGQWKILNVSLSNIIKCGVCSNEEKIYFFGVPKTTVISFNTVTEESFTEKRIERKFKPKITNSVIFNKGRFILLRHKCLLKYSPS